MNAQQVYSHLNRVFFCHHQADTINDMDFDREVPEGIHPSRWRGMHRRVTKDIISTPVNKPIDESLQY